MKPITAETAEGRILLALRAGEMTNSELAERLGHVGGVTNLINLGFVVSICGYYRITDKGRLACPYRNPLAAPGAVQPTTFKPEQTMPIVTRQQVLAAIVEAGAAGISRKALIERFACQETIIDNHIMHLNRQAPAVIIKPEKCRFMAVEFWRDPAKAAPVVAITPSPETPAKIALKSPLPLGSAAQPIAPAMIDELADLITEASHAAPIEIEAVPDRRAPVKIDVDADDLEIGIFTDGSMDFLVDDGLDDAHIKLTDAAVKKLRRFLGLFQEAA